MRIVNGAVAATAIVVCLAGPAAASPVGGDDVAVSGTLTGDGAQAEASVGGDSPGTTPRPTSNGGSRDVTCRRYLVAMEMNGLPGYEAEQPITDTSTLEEGTPVYTLCTDDDTNEIVWQQVELWGEAEPTPSVPPRVVADEALATLSLPVPTIAMNPAGTQYVNFPSVLWVEGSAPASATASAGPVSATVTARPVSVHWDFGNGDTLDCAGLGAPPGAATADSSSGCVYRWPHSSASAPTGAFTVTVTVTWEATWTSNAAPGGPLGTVQRTATTAVRVAEVQALVQGDGT